MTTKTSRGPVIFCDVGQRNSRPLTPVPANAQAYADVMLANHETLTCATTPDEDADYEDFWEEVARSHALIEGTGGDFWIQDEKKGILTHFTTGEVIEHKASVEDNRWGSQPGTLHRRYGIDWINNNPQARAVDLYYNSPTFIKYCGRDLQVQEYIPMEFEYRMFVTNGVVRTGAGNVEYHTPLDNPERKQFFTQLERKRNSGEELSDEAELVSRYVKFGQAVADELATEGFLDYTLDVAVNADTGEVVVIEMNSLTNSGLYACDPVLILEGLHC